MTEFAERLINEKLAGIAQKFKEMAAAAGYSDPKKYYFYLKLKQNPMDPEPDPAFETPPDEEISHWSYVANHYEPTTNWKK